MLANLDRTGNLALLCVNDDVTKDHDEVARVFLRWQEKRWGRPAAWEADVPHVHQRTLDAPP